LHSIKRPNAVLASRQRVSLPNARQKREHLYFYDL